MRTAICFKDIFRTPINKVGDAVDIRVGAKFN